MECDPRPDVDPTAGNHVADLPRRLTRWREGATVWIRTLTSAALYATLIMTFVGQVARVDGLSMEPTLADQDRLVVNKWIYRVSDPRLGDVVMLYYPVDPEKSFVKRVIAGEGDEVRITAGQVRVNGVALLDE